MQQQQPESPQLFEPGAKPNEGYVRKRVGRPSRSMTSLELSPDEREVLGEIARRRGTTIASVLREGLAMVAAQEAKKLAARNAKKGERLAA